MRRQQLSAESTIYHYTLLHKLTRHHPLVWFFHGLLALWVLTNLIYLGVHGLLLFSVSLGAILILHAIVALLLSRFTNGTAPSAWNWAWSPPFYGYVPAGYVPATSWLRVNSHRFFLGFIIIAALYIWLPLAWIINLMAAHYLILLPQLIYVRRCTSRYKHGLLKAHNQYIGYYKN